MPHVYDRELGKFVQTHTFDLPVRKSSEVHKRQRNTEYVKYLIGLEGGTTKSKKREERERLARSARWLAAEEVAATQCGAEGQEVSEIVVTVGAEEIVATGNSEAEDSLKELLARETAALKEVKDKMAKRQLMARETAAKKAAVARLVSQRFEFVQQCKQNAADKVISTKSIGEQTEEGVHLSARADSEAPVSHFFWEDVCEWLGSFALLPLQDVEPNSPDDDDMWKIYEAISSCDIVPGRPGSERVTEYGETALKACWAWSKAEVHADIISGLVSLFQQDGPTKGNSTVWICLPLSGDVARVSERVRSMGGNFKVITPDMLASPECQHEAVTKVVVIHLYPSYKFDAIEYPLPIAVTTSVLKEHQCTPLKGESALEGLPEEDRRRELDVKRIS